MTDKTNTPAPAQPEADRDILMRAIVKAGQDAGIIRAVLEAVSVPECLHILECLSKLRAPVADNWQQYALPGETTAEQVCERMNAEVTRRTVAAMRASAPVAGEANTALNEWFEKTDFIQKRIAAGELPVKYLGWHRADVMRDLIDAAARNQLLPSGCILVQEADTIPHTHPEYGPGIFFTEDARIEFDAAPQASEADPLQGAADWLMRAFEPPLSASDLARQLVIGYNRATRLRDAALSAQPGAQKNGGSDAD